MTNKGVRVSLWQRISVAVLNFLWPFGYFTLEIQCIECGRLVADPEAHNKAFHPEAKC